VSNLAHIHGDKKGEEISEAQAYIQQAIILKYIESNCSKMVSEIAGFAGASASNLLNVFKYPNASYLTFKMFSLLRSIVSKLSDQIDQPKQSRHLSQQYSLLFTLNILAANF